MPITINSTTKNTLPISFLVFVISTSSLELFIIFKEPFGSLTLFLSSRQGLFGLTAESTADKPNKEDF